jgi:hypothetical protein
METQQLWKPARRLRLLAAVAWAAGVEGRYRAACDTERAFAGAGGQYGQSLRPPLLLPAELRAVASEPNE